MISHLDKWLIPDWRQCHRMISVQAWSLALAILGAWGILPNSLREYLPHMMGSAVSVVVFLLALIGTVGRVVNQKNMGARSPSSSVLETPRVNN